MQIHYKKMQGAGNRIAVVDQRDRQLPLPDARQLQRFADNRNGIGFDQLMWIEKPLQKGSFASYRVFNNDGSEVEQCGNGVRCVARVLASEAGAEFRLDSPAGPIHTRILDGGQVSVHMGPVQYEPAQLELDGAVFDVSLLTLGNPHCVLQVDDVNTADVTRLGPLIEHHERFPERINVGFMHILDRHSIDLRVHERGAGETLACGTGACAAVVAGQQLGLLNDSATAFLPGGQLMVSLRRETGTVWLTGDAKPISEGIFDL